jgi:nucleotide-binding universal stress UspA family protein
MFKKILVPTDGSDVSTAGALQAVPIAKTLGASMTVVFVQDPYPYTGIGQSNAAGLQAYMAAAREHGTAAIDQISAAAKAAGVSMDTIIVEDHRPAQGIVDAAKTNGADLIVMGSHGRSGVARLMLGSVASKVLVLSPLPVMIVKSA